MYEKNYELIAKAVILQAAKDYRSTKSVQTRNEIKRFFLSDWFADLTDSDGKKIYTALEIERRAKIACNRKGKNAMAVFRVEKTNNYTVMSNYHLRDKELSLKSKGLLSLMRSLPEEWDYTLKGLAYICKEGVDEIRTEVIELEQFGYVERHKIRNDKGQIASSEYIIRECPISNRSKTSTGSDTKKIRYSQNPLSSHIRILILSLCLSAVSPAILFLILIFAAFFIIPFRIILSYTS